MNKVPKLRFKEFSEEWEEKRLGEVSEIIMGQSPSSSKYNENFNGLPLIQGNADCKNRKVFPRIYTTEITKESFPNDIIMTVRAPVGAISLSNIHSCIGRGVCAIRNASNFIYHYLIKLEDSWDKLAQGSTFTAVNSNNIKNLKINLPLLQEQEKIADFLSSVDKKISIIEEKLDLFKDYKKGIMQKIFNQELRFKDSNGNDYPEWEEKRLGNICYYFNGGSLESYVVNNGKYNLITLNSISIEGNLKKEHKTVNINKNLLNKYDLVMVLSDVAHGNFLGLTAIIPEDNMFVLNQRMGGLKIKYDENVYYLRYYINSNQFYFKLHGQGSSQLNLSKKDIEDFIVKLPCLEEQQKIADFLSSIDNKIDNLAAELENLKEFKKGLLQQMFV